MGSDWLGERHPGTLQLYAVKEFEAAQASSSGTIVADMAPEPKAPSSNPQVSSNKGELSAPTPSFLLPLRVALYTCTISHLLAAAYAPIPDCDETFNYWEPLHYLTHSYGLQTWEYSPEYSIRSWAYILIFTIPARLVGLLSKNKVATFYAIRAVLGLIAAGAETRLYSAICRNLNPRAGVFYLIIVAFSPGIFQASVALLPSSFAMYTSTLGLAAYLDRRGDIKSAQGILCFAIGSLLGWPFAAALIIPLALGDWLLALLANEVVGTFQRYLAGLVRAMAVLTVQVAIDSAFYRKLVVVPWNIIAYNVFSGEDRGPDIFGTEPWHFYSRNLLLNFNLWFLLAIAVAPLLVLQVLVSKSSHSLQALSRTVFQVMPFYLWLGIFNVQAHKEERFMFPVYPFLAFNASLALHVLLSLLGTSGSGGFIGRIPAKVKLFLVFIPVLICVNIGLFRILGNISAYRAPLQIYEMLSRQPGLTKDTTICVGKEWYRFPSSFFLTNGAHLKFVKSEFDGLLPGEFMTASTHFGIPTGAWVVPSGMNDRNLEDPNKHTLPGNCDYLIDSDMPTWQPSSLEPKYVESDQWERLVCTPFMDADNTGTIARIVWVPDLPVLPKGLRRSWGSQCLLQRRHGSSPHQLSQTSSRYD